MLIARKTVSDYRDKQGDYFHCIFESGDEIGGHLESFRIWAAFLLQGKEYPPYPLF
jgi:hypothetical protein